LSFVLFVVVVVVIAVFLGMPDFDTYPYVVS